MNYAVVGYGRMGRAIDERAKARGHRRVAVIDPDVRVRGGRRSLSETSVAGAEVAFEFTTPQESPGNVSRLVALGVPVVCGTTGWTPDRRLRTEAREAKVGVVLAPNFSVGMNLFYRIVRDAARWLGSAGGHQPFVWEHHHAGKADAPSGTALRLAALVARADPRAPEIAAGPLAGPLPKGALHVSAIRAGAEPGTHVVGFDGPFDRIELRHSARGREGFADGAVLAAEWLTEARKAGFHGFDAVLDGLTRRRGRR